MQDGRWTSVVVFLGVTILVTPAAAQLEALPTLTNLAWQETQVLVPDDMQDLTFHLNFGAEVVIDGGTLLVGTQFGMGNDEWPSCPSIGHLDGCDWVYVFNKGHDGRWVQTGKLVPDDPQLKDTFGFTAALDEAAGVIAVGNPGINVGANKMYIFERQPDGRWSQTARFEWTHQDDVGAGAYGRAVAVSGDTVVTAGGDPMRLWVIEKQDGTWVQTQTLAGGGTPKALSMAGDTLVAQSREIIDPCAGHPFARAFFYLYERQNGSWVETARISPSETEPGAHTMGDSVALDRQGDVIVIGSHFDRRILGVPSEACVDADGPGVTGGGAVHLWPGAAGAVGSAWVYEKVGGKWLRTADLHNPTPNMGHIMGGSHFGESVSVSGGQLVVGAPCDFYNAGSCSGAAFVYERRDGTWVLDAKLRRAGAEPLDWFGNSVEIDEGTIVVGADVSTHVGTAHVFERVGGPPLP